ncbi:MAG: acetyltransferase [Thermoleophilia bacterium]|nr:acetyltransferase [Thermoleophilia bacterium]
MTGVEIRHPGIADAERIGAIHVGAWQWAYRGLMPDEFLDGLDPVARGETWAGRLADQVSCLGQVVAVSGGEVVGFASFGESRDDDAALHTGEVLAIYLDPAHVGTGVGRELFGAALAKLRDAGNQRATVWVLDTNERGRRFYEMAGMQPDGATKSDEIRGFPISELRYGMPL